MITCVHVPHPPTPPPLSQASDVLLELREARGVGARSLLRRSLTYHTSSHGAAPGQTAPLPAGGSASAGSAASAATGGGVLRAQTHTAGMVAHGASEAGGLGGARSPPRAEVDLVTSGEHVSLELRVT